MRLLLLFSILSCTVLFSAAQNNVGIGIAIPTNPLHIVAPGGNPLRIEGVVGGAATDSILTLNPQGVVRKRTVTSVLGGTGWLLTGNTGSTTSFLGTTNAASLFFRTNNQKSGFIDFDSTKRNNAFGNRAQNAITTSTTGIGNNAFGYQSQFLLTTGSNNVAIGDSAAYNLTSGNDNVTVGADAGILLGSGSRNVAIGTRSLSTSSAASDNISIGDHTLENNDAAANIAIGSLALNKSVYTSNNIAIGYNALAISPGAVNGNNTSNIAIGNGALSNTITSTDQLALGYNAGYGLATGSYNTLIGHFALSNTFTAASNYNTVVGYQAGGNQTSGSNNTYIGWTAGPGVINASGSNNTYVGYATSSNGNYSNSSALGSGAVATANNMIRIGNTSTTVIGGAVGFSNLSDERIKTNVQEDVKGLPFISLLRPVTYNYNLQKADDLQKIPLNARTSYTEKQAIRYSGFLAQEVEAAAQKTGYNFSGVNKPQNEQSLYSINYSEIVVPLVKAVQELKAMVEKQQQEIEILKAKLAMGNKQ